MFRSLPTNKFIYLSLAMPSINCLDFYNWSLSINKDFTIDLVELVCIFSLGSTSSIIDFLDRNELPLAKVLNPFVRIKLFLVLHDSFIVVETEINMQCTFIELLMAAFCVRHPLLYKHWVAPKMGVLAYYVGATVLRIHAAVG